MHVLYVIYAIVCDIINKNFLFVGFIHRTGPSVSIIWWKIKSFKSLWCKLCRRYTHRRRTIWCVQIYAFQCYLIYQSLTNKIKKNSTSKIVRVSMDARSCWFFSKWWRTTATGMCSTGDCQKSLARCNM